MKKAGNLFLVLFMMIFLSVLSPADETLPKAELPVLTTSAGQSQDVTTLNIICEEAGIGYDYCDVPTADMLSDGVGLGDRESEEGFHVEVNTDLNTYPQGTPYKTIIFAIGASLKGMGASGLTVESEIKRLEEIIDTCKKQNIFIIAVHAGGTSRRGAPGSDNERMIDAVAPFADFIIVTADSNKDKRFNTIAEEKGIPLKEIEYALEMVDVFKEMFN
ncbi:MAG: hypothetical protein JXB26_13720 [Candidatus Aminicenantes bacterium]|nr:hypothetical protein [Candidatus Aminicenantes bacterium]